MDDRVQGEQPRFELKRGILRSLQSADARGLYELVAANRAYLAAWMPWAAGQTLEDTRDFIASADRQEEVNDGFQRALEHDSRIVGVVGFHGVDWENRSTSLGYWIAERDQGKGLATEAVKGLVDHAFGAWQLRRVEVRAAVNNHPSRRVSRRLGFVEEGVLREAEQVGDRYHDLVVYSMLAREWPK